MPAPSGVLRREADRPNFRSDASNVRVAEPARARRHGGHTFFVPVVTARAASSRGILSRPGRDRGELALRPAPRSLDVPYSDGMSLEELRRECGHRRRPPAPSQNWSPHPSRPNATAAVAVDGLCTQAGRRHVCRPTSQFTLFNRSLEGAARCRDHRDDSRTAVRRSRVVGPRLHCHRHRGDLI